MIDAHPTPSRMAYVLAQYIDDPRKIRSHVLSEFQRCPGLTEIERMRATRKRRYAEPISFKARSHRYEEYMAAASASFLRALNASHPYVFDAAHKAGRQAVRR